MEVNAQQYLDVMKDLINQGETVPILISGFSMRPFLMHNRDTILVIKPSFPLKKGDVVLYQRLNGKYILHRIIKVNSDNTYNITGDAQSIIETGVRQSQIVGVVTKIYRKNKWITPKSPTWIFYSRVWVHTVPLRRYIFSIRRLL